MTFTCLSCRVTTFARSPLEWDKGDWVIHCPECGATNILETTTISNIAVPLPTIRVVAWRQ